MNEQRNQSNQVKPGDYFYTSWGYDQTNYDYLVVEKVSPSGKTAVCRMANPIFLDEGRHQDTITPGDAYGPPFRMRIKAYREGVFLRGSYPYVPSYPDDRRLGTFSRCRLGDTHYQTSPYAGH